MYKEKIAKIIQDGVCSGDSSWDEIAAEILKFLSTITDEEAKALKCDDDHMIHTNCFTCGGHAEGLRYMMRAILNVSH